MANLSVERKIFPNAPITEAVIDLRVQLPKDFEGSQLESFESCLQGRYPDKKKQWFFQGGIQVSEEQQKVLETTQGMRGYIFRSEEEQKVIQARIDGLTFSKLKPYDRWETFIAEGQKFWEDYCKISTPERVVRLAIRYINRIDIPFPFSDFNEYILTNPQIAPGLPQGISNLFMRFEFPSEEINSTAIVTQTIAAKPVIPGTLPFIFDIDVVNLCELRPNDTDIWDIFEKLHNFKNKIFFNSITPKAEELFQ